MSPPMTDWSTPRTAPYSVRRRESLRERALDRESPLRRIDWVRCSLGALCAMGARWCGERASRTTLAGSRPDGDLKRDLLNIGSASGWAAVAASSTTGRSAPTRRSSTSRRSWGCVAVLVPSAPRSTARTRGSGRRPGFEIQPSEFAKIALIVLGRDAARRAARRRDRADAATSGHARGLGGADRC